VLHPKYYRVAIQIWARQEGIGNSSHGLRTAYRDWATDTELCSTRKSLGQVPAQTGKAQVLPRRKTTVVVIIRRTSNRKETGTKGVVSLDRGIGVELFPEARP